MGGGIIQIKERDGRVISSMYHVVAIGHNSDGSSSNEKDYVTDGDPEKTPVSSEAIKRGPRSDDQEWGISGDDSPHFFLRKVPYVQRLSNLGWIKSDQRKNVVPKVRVSAIIWGSRWINEAEINPDEVKDSCAMSGGS